LRGLKKNDLHISLFDVYSAKDEYNSLKQDKLERSLSCNAKHDVFSPVVSNYLFENGFQPKYPENKKFAVCISHDLDSLMHYPKHKVAPKYQGGFKNILSIFKYEIQSRFKKGIKEINESIHPSHIQKLAEEYGFKSSYYMLSLKDGEQDFNYQLEDVKSIIDDILKSGNEIGLHGGHKAYNSSEKIKQEKEYLAQFSNPKGYRNHFLRFKVPETWNYIQANGFEYDTTFGFHDMIGFRNGMCYPHRPFDLNKNEFIDLVEVPLIVMDSSLIKYMNLNWEIAFQMVKKLIDDIEEINGVFTILWHNQMYTGENRAFIKRVLDYLKKKDPWMPTSIELVAHYKTSGYLENIEKQVKALQKGE